MSNKVVWFSRHNLTDVQFSEIQSLFGQDVEIERLTDLASVSLETDEQVDAVYSALSVRECPIFGVIPTPLRNRLSGNDSAGNPVFEAWNVQRTPEGGKPTFVHKRFCLTHRI